MVDRLYSATRVPEVPERAHVNKMKKYLNFVGQGVDPRGEALHDMRRAPSRRPSFLRGHGTGTFSWRTANSPWSRTLQAIARPNCETPESADGCSLETVTA